MIELRDNPGTFTKIQYFLFLIACSAFLIILCNLYGCSSYDDISNKNVIIVTDKKKDVFAGFFNISELLKTDNVIFIDKTKFMNTIFSNKTEPIYRFFEKAFDVSEKIKNKSQLDLATYYSFSHNDANLVKAKFTDIKTKFEVIESSYDEIERIRDKVCEEMIGKIAYLKNNEGVTGHMPIPESKDILSSLPPLYTKDDSDKYDKYKTRIKEFTVH